MTTNSAGKFRSGKSHRDENFPVASRLIRSRHRAPILAFYNFVRTADDIADHAALEPKRKLELLDQLEQDLLGAGDTNPEAVTLRKVLAERGLSARHARDLLTAFRMDVTKLRYRDWDELIHYCSFSAMPVGRFVLDVHGEDTKTWPANDALCAALQINNHLQDCQKDYRDLNRVYVPLDALTAEGASVEDLAAPRASPALARCLHGLARRTRALLHESDPFPSLIDDLRLALEVTVIQSLADRIARLLEARDPLCEPVHLGAGSVAAIGAGAVITGLLRRVGRRRSARVPSAA
jgi:hydroxysqualene synthase